MRFFLLALIATYLQAGSINIAVAANVSYAMEKLTQEFGKTHPKIKLRTTLGSSGKLTAQIMHGAPYGVFLCADMGYPQKLYEKGLALTKPQLYAQGLLSLVSKHPFTNQDAIAQLKESKSVKIAVANPKTAPYGRATKEALQNAKIYKSLESKFIYAESISQTLSYTLTAAGMGIVASSALHSKALKEKKIYTLPLPRKLYKPIAQGIVLLKYAKKNPKQSREYQLFYDFIVSKDAQKIFENFGYLKR